jgi:hypothetical protein
MALIRQLFTLLSKTTDWQVLLEKNGYTKCFLIESLALKAKFIQCFPLKLLHTKKSSSKYE